MCPPYAQISQAQLFVSIWSNTEKKTEVKLHQSVASTALTIILILCDFTKFECKLIFSYASSSTLHPRQ